VVQDARHAIPKSKWLRRDLGERGSNFLDKFPESKKLSVIGNARLCGICDTKIDSPIQFVLHFHIPEYPPATA
jgi:hypothetical protein